MYDKCSDCEYSNYDNLLIKYKNLQQKNKQLKDTWNKLKEYLNQREKESNGLDTLIEFNLAFNQVKLKMEELEKENSNE